jgi:hypothetical protein
MRRAPAEVHHAGENLFSELDGEMWLARRIALHSVNIFEGETDTGERRQRFRRAIRDHDLADVVCGRGKDGKPVNYATAFERLYKQKL